MAKVRVYELAKEFGVESKAVMDQLKDMGEFVRSASSTIEAPVVRRLREAFAAQAAQQDQQSAQAKSAQSAGARPADARSPAGAASRAGAGPASAGTALESVSTPSLGFGAGWEGCDPCWQQVPCLAGFLGGAD